MGNSESSGDPDRYDDIKFNPRAFVQPGISEKEVIGIYEIFKSMEPDENDEVSVDKIKQSYKESFDKDQLDNLFGARKTVDFRNFYNVMAQNIIDKKRKYGNVEFDSQDPQTSCFVCPYPTVVQKRAARQY